MAGEHLPLSNYDSLSPDEIKEKLTILLANGSPNLDAVLEYEKAGENRSDVTSFIEKALEGKVEIPASLTEPSDAAGSGGTGESKKGGAKS